MKSRYKLLTGTHGRYEDGINVRYRRDEFIDLTDEEAKSLGGRVQLVSVGVSVGNGGVDSVVPDTVTDTDYSYLSGLSWQDAVKEVESLSNVEQVAAAIMAEESGRNRASVLNAGNRRMTELSEQ